MLKLIALLLCILQQVALQPCPAGLEKFVNNLGPYCFNHLLPGDYKFIKGGPHFSECFHLFDTRYAFVMNVKLKNVTEVKLYKKAEFSGHFYIIVHQLEVAEVIEKATFSTTTIEFVLIWIGRLECPGLQYRNGILRIIEGNLNKYGASAVFSKITSDKPNDCVLREIKMDIVKKYELGTSDYIPDFKILESFQVRFKVYRPNDSFPRRIVYGGISASFRDVRKKFKGETRYTGAFVRKSRTIFGYDSAGSLVNYTHVWNHVPYATDHFNRTVPPGAVVVKWMGISHVPRKTLNAIESKMAENYIQSFDPVNYGIRSGSTVFDFLIGKVSQESGDFYFDAVVIHTKDIFAQIGEFQKDTKTCSLKKAYANANFAANDFVSWERDVDLDKTLDSFKPKVKELLVAELKLLYEDEERFKVDLHEFTKVTIGFPGYNGHLGNYAVNGKRIKNIEDEATRADIEILHVLAGTVANFEQRRCKQHFLILYNSKTWEARGVGHFADTLNELLLIRKHDMFTATTSYASSSEPTTVPFVEQDYDIYRDYKYES